MSDDASVGQAGPPGLGPGFSRPQPWPSPASGLLRLLLLVWPPKDTWPAFLHIVGPGGGLPTGSPGPLAAGSPAGCWPVLCPGSSPPAPRWPLAGAQRRPRWHRRRTPVLGRCCPGHSAPHRAPSAARGWSRTARQSAQDPRPRPWPRPRRAQPAWPSASPCPARCQLGDTAAGSPGCRMSRALRGLLPVLGSSEAHGESRGRGHRAVCWPPAPPRGRARGAGRPRAHAEAALSPVPNQCVRPCGPGAQRSCDVPETGDQRGRCTGAPGARTGRPGDSAVSASRPPSAPWCPPGKGHSPAWPPSPAVSRAVLAPAWPAPCTPPAPRAPPSTPLLRVLSLPRGPEGLALARVRGGTAAAGRAPRPRLQRPPRWQHVLTGISSPR